MVFENKGKRVNYYTYRGCKNIVEKRIYLNPELSNKNNKVIAVFNNESDMLKIDNSSLTTIVYDCFYNYLEKLSEEEAIDFIGAKAYELLNIKKKENKQLTLDYNIRG